MVVGLKAQPTFLFVIPFGFHIGGLQALSFTLRLLLPKSLIFSKMGPLWKSKIRFLDFASGSLLLAALLKPSGFSRSAVHSPWRTPFGFTSHPLLRLLLPKSLIFSKMGPLWKSKIRFLDFASGSLLLAALLKPSGFSRSAVHSPWRTPFGFTSHPLLRLLLPKSLIFSKMGPLWKSKIRLLDFASGSSRATSFQKRLCTFSIPFGFHIGGFRSLTFASPYTKSAILSFYALFEYSKANFYSSNSFIAFITANILDCTFNFVKIALTCAFDVWDEMCKNSAISLLDKPLITRFKTSNSLFVSP